MVAVINHEILLGLFATPLFSLLCVILVVFLCLDKRKKEDSENGIIKSSGSYSKANNQEEDDKNAVYAEPDVVPKAEGELFAALQDVKIEFPSQTDDSNSHPRIEGRLSGQGLSPPRQSMSTRPREASPNLSNARRSLETTDGGDPPYATSKRFVVETSDSGETSGNGLYARVKQVERVQEEIAYSVVDLKGKEEEYEFVGNKVQRKSSQDIEKEDLVHHVHHIMDHTPPLPHSAVVDKEMESKMESSPQNMDQSNVYARVEDPPPPPGPHVSYQEVELESSDLYATVSEVPKPNSLPPNTKAPKWKPFKQSKRRSRTMEDSGSTTREESAKPSEKKGPKKKLGRLKSDSDEVKSASPITPPLPPLESLKTKAKESNARKSMVDDSGTTTKSSEGTPVGSPRLGALPKIPVTTFGFQALPPSQDEFYDDDTYEELGAGNLKTKTPIHATVEKCQHIPTNVNLSTKSGRSQSEGSVGRSMAAATLDINKHKGTKSLGVATDFAALPGRKSDGDIGQMYAQVMKPRPGVSNIVDDHSSQELSSRGERESPSEMYAIVHKERKHDAHHPQEGKEHVTCLGDTSRTLNDVEETSGDNVHVNMPLSKREDVEFPLPAHDHKEARSHSELHITRDPYDSDDIEVSPVGDSLKPRSHTEPSLDMKAMYAQVDLEKKRVDRQISGTYSQVQKFRTGKKNFHHVEPEALDDSDMLYEGTYNIIAGSGAPDKAPDIDDTGYVTSRTLNNKTRINNEVVVMETQAQGDPKEKASYSDDGEAYASVDEL